MPRNEYLTVFDRSKLTPAINRDGRYQFGDQEVTVAAFDGRTGNPVISPRPAGLGLPVFDGDVTALTKTRVNGQDIHVDKAGNVYRPYQGGDGQVHYFPDNKYFVADKFALKPVVDAPAGGAPLEQAEQVQRPRTSGDVDFQVREGRGDNRIITIDGAEHEFKRNGGWYFPLDADFFAARANPSPLKLHINGNPDPKELSGKTPEQQEQIKVDRLKKIQAVLIKEFETNPELRDLLGPARYKTVSPFFATDQTEPLAAERRVAIPDEKDQGAKTFTVYAKDEASMQTLAKKLDSLLAADPELRLDRALDTGNVDVPVPDGANAIELAGLRDYYEAPQTRETLYSRDG